jgi:hypothetical protein
MYNGIRSIQLTAFIFFSRCEHILRIVRGRLALTGLRSIAMLPRQMQPVGPRTIMFDETIAVPARRIYIYI